jgi:hypothetical protein
LKNAIFLDVTPRGSRKKELAFQKNVLPTHWLLQEPRGVTSRETAFFIVIAMKRSNLTLSLSLFEIF